MRCLELVRADTAEVRVAAYGIVESVDIAGYVRDRSVPTRVDAFLDPLLFQTAEEGLSDRVVPAVGASAHAWLKMVAFAKAPPCIAPILRALIRVDQSFT